MALAQRLTRREVTLARVVGALVAACVLFAVVHTAVTGAVSHPRNWLVAFACTLLGVRVIGHVRRSSVGWLLLVMGVFGAVAIAVAGHPADHPARWVEAWVWWPTYALLPAVALVFPNGKPLSNRWWIAIGASLFSAVAGTLGIAWASWGDPASFWQSSGGGVAKTITLIAVLAAGVSVLAAVVSLALRWRRAEGDERRLLVWAFALLTLAGVATVVETTDGHIAWIVGVLAFPAAAVIAILRYGLYDISLLIHRSLLYGSLTVVLLLVYLGVMVGAGQLFAEDAEVIGVVAAGLVFAPIRSWVQRKLDRWLYGDRSDPYATLSTLSEKLEQSQDVLATVAQTVAESLKLPYVAIRGGSVLAEHGRSRGWPQLRFPMTYRGSSVGDLVVEPRAPDERLSDRELSLLVDLARSTAPAAQSIKLTADLQLARERLVRAREEERLRLRRDLHDGVGPALVGIRLQLKALRRSLGDVLDPVLADVDTTAVEVRSLVDGLRPPILDQGLALAVRDEAARFGGDLRVKVEAEQIDGLSAAVEVAAYRIVAEALTNTARHSGASTCVITVRADGDLVVEIVDDGRGVAADSKPGVGLDSMRERCAELGGSCTVGPAEPHGTRVVARIPLEAQ
ncbi:Histidine kinase-, DNA gyrase B-, and HSP90-like ATPase [Lentzea albidocapillata subsp. violacea]|uniref:histidine kinase n=1 Tax=Lentzea albidocapillata subsp. violacea TaxID=128104 RepID=A0A1G9J4F2_9PSEU|nr:ATP-binding protein [Lentzea albidocapillata]SDL32103.1 Histidine kinase-, DNA gyrase B-, and HSP90-like ATPase [Lentzea albidocapillata subsp. violacea]